MRLIVSIAVIAMLAACERSEEEDARLQMPAPEQSYADAGKATDKAAPATDKAAPATESRDAR